MAGRKKIEQPTWSVDHSEAQLTGGGLNGQVNVACPQAGVHNLIARGARLEGHLLAVSRATDNHWPLRLAESYVRERDLVAIFEPALDWPYAPQIYWRAEDAASPEAAFGALSLLVSVQTHLLDTCPRIAVATQLPADEIIQIREGCLLWRLAGGELTYAEMMLPSDYRDLKIEPGSHRMPSASWELFAEFLEKGVIRKARLKAVLLPRENDIALANGCYEALSQQPLPLTT